MKSEMRQKKLFTRVVNSEHELIKRKEKKKKKHKKKIKKKKKKKRRENDVSKKRKKIENASHEIPKIRQRKFLEIPIEDRS